MPTRKVLVVGAGGHAKVVVDAILEAGQSAGDLVVAARVRSEPLLGIRVLTPEFPQGVIDAPKEWAVHVAIGDNASRQRLLDKAVGLGMRSISIVHPKASVARSAELADGCFVAAQAVVAPRAEIDAGAIINHGAIIDHDCQVGPAAHIGPSASLGGGALVGARAFIGAGARILPGVRVGHGAVIGAGAVVLENVPPNSVCVGVPARIVRGVEKDI